MASQPVMEAAARESRANAREDMAVLTSGAREKVDSAMASMQSFGQTLLHPLDKTKKEEAQATAEQQKVEARGKRDEIRSIAAQQAGVERAAARSMVAKEVSEVGGTRYPVLTTTQQALDPNFPANQPQETATSTPHALDPDYHPNHPPVSENPLHDRSSTDDNSRLDALTPLEAIRVDRSHDKRPVVGGADTSTQAPVPVLPPSRDDQSGEQGHQGEKAQEGAEDTDYYPPTRIVQT